MQAWRSGCRNSPPGPRKVLAPNSCDFHAQVRPQHSRTPPFLLYKQAPHPRPVPPSLLTSQCSLSCGKTESLGLVKNRGNWQLFTEACGGGKANRIQLLL